MNEKKAERREEAEIDISKLFKAVLGRLWLILIVAVVFAVIAYFYSTAVIVPQYKSSAKFYVNNSDLGSSLGLSYADLTVSKDLVSSYIVILNSRPTLEDISDYAEVDYSADQLRGMINATSVDGTEIFEVTVTGADPEEITRIANAVAVVLPKRISGIIEGTSAKVVETAVVPTVPSSPNTTMNVLVGFLLGIAGVIAVVIIHEMLDTTLRTEEDIKQVCDLPILAAVPDINTSARESKYGYSRAYGVKKRNDSDQAANKGKPVSDILGEDTPFTVSEAYKLLRTKLEFFFVDTDACHVIGVSSALSGEGKSITSVNLAFALAQMDKKVLLVECDLRRPSISNKLSLNRIPGLSNLLTQAVTPQEVIQICQQKNGNPVHVLTAGRIPPNPIELLGSAKMESLLESFRGSYDYLILDLPPVMEVSDALVVAKTVDGMLLVVRQNYCDRKELSATIRQFEFINAHLLGLVMNCSVDDIRRYPKNYAGNYYYKAGKYLGVHSSRNTRSQKRSYHRYARAQEAELATEAREDQLKENAPL